MRTLDRSRPYTSANGAGHRPTRSDHAPARRPSPELIADGVTAGYIHDISQRRRRVVRVQQTPVRGVETDSYRKSVEVSPVTGFGRC